MYNSDQILPESKILDLKQCMNLTSNDTSCKTPLVYIVKKVWPSKVESYLEMNVWTDWWQQDFISEYTQGALHTEHINTY